MPKKAKNPRGRPRKKKKKGTPGRPKVCMPFEDAVALVRQENIQSFRDYLKWYEFHAPARIPKRPDRAYHKEWKGWGYYLGNYNDAFPKYRRKKFRPYEDAKTYAHHLGFTSVTQWHAFCKTGEKPDDIPARPDIHYKKTGEWFTWTDFLGTRINHRLDHVQERQQYFYIARYPDAAFYNVYTFGTTISVINTLRDEAFEVLKIYEMHENFDWVDVVDTHGEPFYGSGRPDEYLIKNPGAFLSEVSLELMEVPISQFS